MGIFNYIMQFQWLSDLVKLLVENIFGLPKTTRLGESIHFFIYDTIKIFIMLSVIIFIVSIIRSYFPPEKTKRILGAEKERGFLGNILAALLGIVTPFAVVRLFLFL